MNIYQSGYSCEDKIKIFARLFFLEKEDVEIYSYFSKEKCKVNIYTTILFEGKSYFDDYFFSYDENDIRIDKKVIDAAVTYSFCCAALKIRKINLPWGMMCGIRPAKMFRELYEKGFLKQETFDFLKMAYHTDDEKLKLSECVSENEKAILESMGENSVSVYIGIPFCPTRCLYCSFVSTDIRNSGKYIEPFVECLCKEIEKTGDIIKKLGVYVENIYIGGGTPTTLSAEQLEKIYLSLEKNIELDKLKEFTLEAGRPDTITYDKLAVSKKHGVNRISINPQTMCDATLEKIGRKHTSQLIYEAYSIARNAGFDNINMDLIAGLPDETPEIFYETVEKIIELNPENVTVHSMCVKRAADLNRKNPDLTSAEYMNKMLSYAQRRMKETGREPYYMYRQKNMSGNLENVGYAKRGTFSFYNVNIMEEVQTIIALGGGASSKIVKGDKIERIFNFKDPVEYINKFDEIIKRKDEIYKMMKG